MAGAYTARFRHCLQSFVVEHVVPPVWVLLEIVAQTARTVLGLKEVVTFTGRGKMAVSLSCVILRKVLPY